MSVGRSAKAEFCAVWLILVLVFSFCAISCVKASPKIEWAQVSNPSIGGNAAWGVAVDASGIYVVGFDNSVGPDDVEWRIEKRGLADGSLLWTQTNNPSPNEDRAFGVAVDASGIYVVGFDSSLDINNIQWRIEKISAEVATPFYMQTWFIIVSLAVLVMIILFAVVITMHRKKEVSSPTPPHHKIFHEREPSYVGNSMS